jgi:hypothetical protein
MGALYASQATKQSRYKSLSLSATKGITKGITKGQIMPRYAGMYNRLSKKEADDQVDMADVMRVYRADPTNKSGGKDRMETLPTKISRADLYGIASILNRAEKAGMPRISSEELANRVLVEGRGDAGGSYFDSNKKKYRDIDAALGGRSLGLQNQTDFSTGPGFAATYANKVDVAKRLGISLDKAWIGTGKSEAGETGDAYALKAQAHKHAATHPKNALLMDYINRAREGKLTPQEVAMAEIQDKEKRGLHTRKITDPIKLQQYILADLENNPNAYKAVSALDPQALQHMLHNFYRRETGIPEKPWGSYSVHNKDEPDNLGPHPKYPGVYLDNPNMFRRSSMDERGTTSVVAGLPAVQDIFRSITGLPKPKPVQEVPLETSNLFSAEYGSPMASGGSVQMPQEYSQGNWKLI